MRVRRPLLWRSAVLWDGYSADGVVSADAEIGEARAWLETPQNGKQQEKGDKQCRLTQRYASPKGYHHLT